jgi:hypothetical protein
MKKNNLEGLAGTGEKIRRHSERSFQPNKWVNTKKIVFTTVPVPVKKTGFVVWKKRNYIKKL